MYLDERQASPLSYLVEVPCQVVVEWQRLEQARVWGVVRYRLDMFTQGLAKLGRYGYRAIAVRRLWRGDLVLGVVAVVGLGYGDGTGLQVNVLDSEGERFTNAQT